MTPLDGQEREALSAFVRRGAVAGRMAELADRIELLERERDAALAVREEPQQTIERVAKAITMQQTGDPHRIGEFRTIARIAVEASRTQDLQCTASDDAVVLSDTQPAEGAPELNGPGGSPTRRAREDTERPDTEQEPNLDTQREGGEKQDAEHQSGQVRHDQGAEGAPLGGVDRAGGPVVDRVRRGGSHDAGSVPGSQPGDGSGAVGVGARVDGPSAASPAREDTERPDKQLREFVLTLSHGAIYAEWGAAAVVEYRDGEQVRVIEVRDTGQEPELDVGHNKTLGNLADEHRGTIYCSTELQEALDVLAEALEYVPDYFREKWDMDALLRKHGRLTEGEQ